MKFNYLKDKVALVSGSSMGIGKAIAFELANQGAKIVLNGRDPEKLNRVKSEFLEFGFDTIAIQADIRYPDKCRQLIETAMVEFGRLDILINNAGMSSRGSIEDMADTNLTILSETNYTGAAHLSKYAIPYLK